MTYAITSDVLPPAPDGSAERGPRLHVLDLQARDGVLSGLYSDTLEAAKVLAPKYRTAHVWEGLSKEQRRSYIKSKRKHYDKMMERLG